MTALETSDGEVPSTLNPVTPSSTASGAPPERPAITGKAQELASK